MAGFVAIDRDILSSWVYENPDPDYFKWWFDLFTRAAYKEKSSLIGKRMIRIHKRQLLEGINSFARRWNADRKKVRFFFRNLVETGMITYTSSHNISIVTIEFGFPDGFGEMRPDRKEARRTTLSQQEQSLFSDSYEDSACEFGDIVDYPADSNTDYLEPSFEPSQDDFSTSSLSESCNENPTLEASKKSQDNPGVGTTLRPPYNKNIVNNNINPNTHTITRARDFSEDKYFTDVLKSNACFVKKTKVDFCLKDDQQVFDYLQTFLAEQCSYVRIDNDAGQRWERDVNKRLRNYQNHFWNWLRCKLSGKYRPFNPKLVKSQTNLNNRNLKLKHNEVYIDPCKRDTTRVFLGGSREDYLRGFYDSSE